MITVSTTDAAEARAVIDVLTGLMPEDLDWLVQLDGRDYAVRGNRRVTLAEPAAAGFTLPPVDRRRVLMRQLIAGSRDVRGRSADRLSVLLAQRGCGVPRETLNAWLAADVDAGIIRVSSARHGLGYVTGPGYYKNEETG